MLQQFLVFLLERATFSIDILIIKLYSVHIYRSKVAKSEIIIAIISVIIITVVAEIVTNIFCIFLALCYSFCFIL